VNSASEFHPSYAMHYPYLQAALLRHASAAGVQVLRPARAVAGGQDDAGPFMTARHDDTDITFRPDLVVIADGRNSVAHRWLDARVVTDPPWRHIMSARVADLGIKESAMHFGYGVGEKALALPYGGGAGRIYLVCPASLASSFRGHSGFAEFLASASRLLPAGALGGVRQTGPVFGVAGHNKRVIVEKPASRIVLAGDAAGSTDPCMAMGLSLCFRDAYSLAGLILNGRPGNVAAEFRKARQSYFSVHLRHAAWSMRLWFEEGPAAESLRREVMLARSDDPYAGGWEDIYVDGADPMMEIPDGPGQFFGGTVPEWAECDDFG
jgi:2-polyprenyl-6-methoxyphenol hydroxylase-like FAD-dependent oxidoreductase